MLLIVGSSKCPREQVRRGCKRGLCSWACQRLEPQHPPQQSGKLPTLCNASRHNARAACILKLHHRVVHGAGHPKRVEDHLEHLHLRLPDKWWAQPAHFVHNAAKRPDVHGGAVVL